MALSTLRRSVLSALVSISLLSGCVLVDDFGKFTFGDAGPRPDGGTPTDARLPDGFTPMDGTTGVDGTVPPDGGPCDPPCPNGEYCAVDMCVPDEVRLIRAGGDQACAVMTSGTPRCWGSNFYGNLGRPFIASARSTGQPPLPFALAQVEDIAIGQNHTCAVTESGELYCVGSNISALGLGSDPAPGFDYLATPTRVMFPGTAAGPVQLATAGYAASCAVLADMETWCWGDNTGGVVGISVSMSNVVMPRMVETQPDVGRITAISLMYDTACALGEAGTVECWGNNSSGEFGDNAVAPSTHIPQAVPGMFQRLSVGYRAVCAITEADALQCWGRNTWQGAGGPSGESMVGITTIALPGGATPLEVGAGEDFACAIGRTGATNSVYCWGKNDQGQCGVDPLTTIVWPPAPIGGADNAIGLAVGDSFACALIDEGGARSVKCWGTNYYASLGVPYETVEWSTTPLTVALF